MSKPTAVKPPMGTILRLLVRHLRVVRPWRWPLLLGRLLASTPGHLERFSRSEDDEGARVVKKRFALLGALHHELCNELGEEAGKASTLRFATEMALLVQRHLHAAPQGVARSWRTFFEAHEQQLEHGILRFQELQVVADELHEHRFFITRCRFHEAFRDMDAAYLTEAFCRSDEAVYDDYSADMRFHRGTEEQNTIARGAERCTFIFERSRHPRCPPSRSARAATR